MKEKTNKKKKCAVKVTKVKLQKKKKVIQNKSDSDLKLKSRNIRRMEYIMKSKKKTKNVSNLKNSLITSGCEQKGRLNTTGEKKLRYCAKCHEIGHRIAKCTKNKKKGHQNRIEVSNKPPSIHSTQHLDQKFPTKVVGGITYAVCFKCNKVGHISRNCPHSSSSDPS